jgi:D-inositol-3-phosphate glycosyltransferase
MAGQPHHGRWACHELISRLPRVLYSFPHPLGGPGINTTAREQVLALASLGMNVTVYCTSLAEGLPRSVRVVQTLSVGGRRIPHRAVGLQCAYDYHDRRVAVAVTRRIADLVHVWPGSCLRTISAASRAGVISFRELPNAHTEDTFADAARAGDEIGVVLPKGYSHRYDSGKLDRETAEFAAADWLLAPSSYVADSFTRRGFSSVLSHRYGYDPDRFRPGPRDPDRPFSALFVGRIEAAKGLHIALTAWRDSGLGSKGRFIVAGRAEPTYERYLRDSLHQPGVEYVGFTSDPAALYRRADVLVFPTYTEGSALVAYEALASGVIPLVSTAAGAPVRDGIDGLLHEVGDTAALTGQLRSLAEDSARRERMRCAGVAASANLTWAAAGRALLDAYRAGLARSARQPPSG